MPDIKLSSAFANPNIIIPGFTDQYARADATSLGTTANGRAYALSFNGAAAAWHVASGQARYAGGSARSAALVDGYASDGTLTATVGAIGTAVGGLAFRALDVSNHLCVNLRQAAGTNRIVLGRRIAGSLTSLGTSAASKLSAAGSVISVVGNGTQVSVLLNGEQVIAPVTVTDFATVTTHGLIGESVDTTVTWEALEFVAAA